MMNSLWENLFRKDKKQRELLTILRENYIFAGLSRHELWFVSETVHTRSYAPGESIFQQGEIGVGMYIISRGHVDVFIGSAAVEPNRSNNFVTRLAPGDFFGEISLVEEGGRRAGTAIAVDDCTLIGFFRPDLMEIISRNPATGNKILLRMAEVLGRRLKETSARLMEMHSANSGSPK
jgi:CRP-like cAMP-binding protein